MKYDNIMVYLERLRVFCFQDGEHLLKVPFEGDWSMHHMEEALSEARDIIYDYWKATEQTNRLTMKYETPKAAIGRGTGDFMTWQCPSCQQFVGRGNEHCRWCGQMLGWEWSPKRKEKHMKNRSKTERRRPDV